MSLSAVLSSYHSYHPHTPLLSIMSDPSHFSGTISTSAMSAYSLLPLQSLRANSFTVDNAAADSATFEQLLPTLLHHQPPVRQTSQTPLQPLIPTDMPIINNIENNSAASSWSSDSSPSGSSSTDEWLTALPPVQTPSNSITASSASTSSRASPATLLPISYSASLFGNQANESSFYGSTCANTAPPFAFRANSTTESGSLPLMQSLAAASSHSSTAITASTAAAALSSSHSSSNSFKSNSLPPIPSPLSFPSTSTCSVSSSSSHSGSPLSPVSPSASFEEASSASRAKSRRQLNWRARLESQKRYDRKRRSTIRVLFESLRKILKSSQLVTKEVEKKIEESCGKSEDQKDENSAMVAKKKSKKRPKERNFDDFSTIDLVAAASTAIRHLNGMKEKLEKQLDELRTDDRTIDGAIDPNELEREFYYCKEEELEDWERRHRYTHMIDAEEMDSADADEQHTPSPSTDIVLGRADSIASVSSPSACSPAAVDGLQFSKQFRSTSGVHLNELQSLLHTIHVLNLQYTIDMEAVRELENQLPKEVSDLATYFGGSFGILGMDGRVAMVLKVNSNHPAKKQFDRYFSQQYHAAHRRFRAPHIVQMHALAYVMGSGFKYQPFDEDEDQKFKDQDSKANFNEKFDTHNPFGDDGDDDDTAAEKRQPWSTAQIMQFLTNGMSRFSLSDSSASKSSAKDYRSHPLGSYALPPESFKLLVEVLGYLSNLDLAEYDRQWTQLSGIAAEIFPFPLFGWKMPIMAIKQMVFNPISKVTHAEAKGFYELYSGLKPIISMKRRKMFMNGELRYVDWDIMLIKHPESGLPLAHFTIPRALYSDAELQALEDRMYNNCPPELQEVMKIQQHQRQAQRQDTFPTATTTNPTAAKN